MVLLAGKKVRLRNFTEKDLPKIKKWLNDPEIQWFTEEEFPIRWTDELIQHLYAKALRGKREMYAVETLDGVLVGEVWLNPISHEHRFAEMVITIDRQYHGLGYGKEAVQLILRHGFNHLELHRIEIKVYSFNQKAIQMYKNVGFYEEGRLRERIQRNGEYYDQIYMAILQKEYQQLRERSKTS